MSNRGDSPALMRLPEMVNPQSVPEYIHDVISCATYYGACLVRNTGIAEQRVGIEEEQESGTKYAMSCTGAGVYTSYYDTFFSSLSIELLRRGLELNSQESLAVGKDAITIGFDEEGYVSLGFSVLRMTDKEDEPLGLQISVEPEVHNRVNFNTDQPGCQPGDPDQRNDLRLHLAPSNGMTTDDLLVVRAGFELPIEPGSVYLPPVYIQASQKAYLMSCDHVST